jgi:hypothetical protein
MSAHLSRLRLFQRHLRSLGWVWVWVWDWVHTPPHTLLSSRHPPFTQYPSPSRSLVRDGQTSPHKPRLVVPHSTCPSLSPFPPAHSFIIGPAVINTHTSAHWFVGVWVGGGALVCLLLPPCSELMSLEKNEEISRLNSRISGLEQLCGARNRQFTF